MIPPWNASELALLTAYVVSVSLLCILGLHRLSLLARGRRAVTTPGSPQPAATLPSVTVQLPVMNERFVVERLLRSVAALDYPRDRLEVQVLDDSTDDTSDVVAAVAAGIAATGIRIDHRRRPSRRGFKAGALAEGLAAADGELLMILDADFVVPRDFLLRAVPCFQDAAVGMVQARWGHLNARGSLLTRAQALMLDGHFGVQQRARHMAGLLFNFNGTAGLFRREAIEAAGGWQSDTLTEDLDLSYRMQLAGYRGVYLDELVAEGELPEAVGALKSQQHRWAKGSIETCRKLLLRVWRSSLPLQAKIEATFHLGENVAYVLLLLLSVLALPALAVRESHGLVRLAYLDLAALGCGVGSLFAFYGVAARRRGAFRRVAEVPVLMALGVGLSVNNSLAVVGGLLHLRSGFVRTPKTGGSAASFASVAYRPRRDLLFVLELGLGGWTAAAVAYAAGTGIWAALPFLALLAAGHLWVGGLSFASFLASRSAAAGTRWQNLHEAAAAAPSLKTGARL